MWRLLTFLAVAVLWQIFAKIQGDERLFPSLDHIVMHSFPELALFAQGQSEPSFFVALNVIGKHSLDTITRIIAGLSVGAFVGFATGLGIHFFKHSARSNAIVLACVRAVPLMGLIPLFIYWFGNKGIGIPIYIAFGGFVVLAPVTYEAVSLVPPSFLEQAKVLGANRIRRFLTIYPFAIQPQLFSALRDVVGLSWAFSLGAEYIAARSGLGFLAYQSYLYADMGKLVFLACIYIIYGFVTFMIISTITRYVGRWYFI